jgi:hypothetical protein
MSLHSIYKQVPRPYGYRDFPSLSYYQPKYPTETDIPNVVKHYLYLFKIKLLKVNRDNILRRRLDAISESFDKTQLKYLEACAYHDKLTYESAGTLGIQNLNEQTPYYVDYQYRMGCRIAEVKLLKERHARKMIILRLQFMSINMSDLIYYTSLISAWLTPSFFAYSNVSKTDYLIVIQWIMTWILENLYLNKKAVQMVDNFICNLEIFIDAQALEKMNEFKNIGGHNFAHLSSVKYINALHHCVSRREAYYFLLVANFYNSNRISTNKKLKPCFTAESQFFRIRGLVDIVITYLTNLETNVSKLLFEN